MFGFCLGVGVVVMDGGDSGGWRRGVRSLEAPVMYCFGFSSGDGTGFDDGQVSV